MQFGKRAYYRLLLMPGLASSFRYAQRDRATIFMLHRFRDVESRVEGLDPSHLRRGLEYLRRNRYELVSLAELFERLAGNGPKLRGAVAFTVDDGHLDQAEIGAPIFSAFDCPVTTFVTTGFLDGDLWPWFDKVAYIFSKTRRKSLSVRLGETTVQYNVSPKSGRSAMSEDFAQRCKRVADDEKNRAIARLAREAEVDLPDAAPPGYAPMTWDHLRACERRGMTFGPHSVSHPILSRTRPEQAAWEITHSWRRLREEAQNPVPIFCFPNGSYVDFGAREIAIAREAGFVGAVTAEFGHADVASFQRGSDGPFKLKRVPFPEELYFVAQYVSGIERFKQIVRGLASSAQPLR